MVIGRRGEGVSEMNGREQACDARDGGGDGLQRREGQGGDGEMAMWMAMEEDVGERYAKAAVPFVW